MPKKRKFVYSGIGGQAVLEGVMMKNKDLYAVAVRKPDGDIDVETAEYHGVLHNNKIKELPFLRGIFNFLDSLILGMRVINHSASFFDEDEEVENKTESFLRKVFGDRAEKVLTGFVALCSIALALIIFVFVPYILSSLLDRYVRNETFFALMEGVIRLIIFISYVVAITAVNDVKRLYMYHGAEHKCISCIENGHRLNLHNVRLSSRYHKRCGSSFVIVVMIISIIVFMVVRVDTPAIRLLARIILIPFIAGISYEFIRLAGRWDNPIMKLLSLPGFALQRLTTMEPDDDMILVAMKSVEAVFDWRGFLDENFPKLDVAQSSSRENTDATVDNGGYVDDLTKEIILPQEYKEGNP